MKVAFNLFKNNHKEKESHPDYNMSTYDKETQKSTKVGACWIKKSEKGSYLSCQYNDEPYEPKKNEEAIKAYDEIDPDKIPF